MSDVNQNKQPREKFRALGASALTDAELLAIILRSGVHGMPVMDLSRQLLENYGGNLLSLSEATPLQLQETYGMGETKAIVLCAAFALVQRMVTLRLQRPWLNTPETVAAYLRETIDSPEQEEFHALLMDTKLGLRRDVLVSRGLVDRSLVHPREIFREAVREACTGVLIVHNHPSGDVTPSDEDILATRDIVKAGKIIGISILDHIIVATPPMAGKPEWYSFRRNKLIL